MKRTFIYTDDKTCKFWTIEVNNNAFTVTYGKTGTAGQTQTKQFADEAACLKEANKLMAEKTKKGYAEEGKTVEKPQPVNHSEPKLIPFRSGSKFGFCTPDKRMIIPVQYDGCRQFSEGLAVVKIGDKCGVINMQNELVIPAVYDNIGTFHNGYTFVVKNKKCGFIDRTGKEVVPCKYNDCFDKVMEGMIAIQKGKKWGFYNTQGEEVTPFIYDDVEPFQNGHSCVMKKADQTTYWGAIDKTGKEVVPVIYQLVRDFSEEGLAAFKIKFNEWGFIDGTGNIVIPAKFKHVEKFINGMAAVETKNGWGFIDTKGNWVIEPKYGGASPFSEGLASASVSEERKGYKRGYINTSGEPVIPFTYNDAHDFSDGLAFVSQDSKFANEHNYSIIDKTGKVVGKIDTCISATPFDNGISIVQVPAQKSGETAKYGIIDKTGKPLTGFRYEDMNEFIEGVAEVNCPEEFEKYAFIDIHGTEFWEKDNNMEAKLAQAEKEYKARKTPAPPAATVLDNNTFPKYTELIAKKTAKKYYLLSKCIEHPFIDFPETEAETDEYDNEYQELRIFKGDLHVSGIKSTKTRDWNLYSLIVDGNLNVDGDIDWAEGNNGSFIYVTGSVKARNLLLSGNPEIYIEGNLEVENGILGSTGDDGGRLTVVGKTNAQTIVNTTYFMMGFSSRPQATIISDPGYINCNVDFNDSEEAEEALLPEYWDKTSIDEEAIEKAFIQGKPILKKTAQPLSSKVQKLLEKYLKNPDKVTEINLKEKRLTEFPSELLMFTNLKKLNIAGNNIKELPASISMLKNLQDLDISNMPLRTLPPEIGELTELRKLDIEYCSRLESLPDEIGNLKKLKTLLTIWLNCPLPETFDKLESLEELTLKEYHGEIRDDTPNYERRVVIPEIVFRLKKLKSLSIRDTLLKELPEALLNLKSLEYLDLDSCLYNITVPDLSQLPRLKVLHFSGGAKYSGKRPDRSVFLNAQLHKIITLEELHIDRWYQEGSREGLQSLPDDFFVNMPNLKTLDISFNDFTRLPASLYRLKKLKSVNTEYLPLLKEEKSKLKALIEKNKSQE